MKKTLLFIFLIIISYALYCSESSSYDFTFYETTDNSVMGVREDKLGLDITGYGFLGKDAKRGIYLRIGIQSPFDTIFGYLNLAKNKIIPSPSEPEGQLPSELPDESIAEKDPVMIAEDNIELAEDLLNESFLPPSLPEDQIFDNIIPPSLPEDQISDSIIPPSLPEEEIPSEPPTLPELNIPEVTDKETEATVKKTIKKDSFVKEWRFLLTVGPAYRSFLSDKAMVYLGYGLSCDFGHKSNPEKNSSIISTNTYAIIGSDLDLGFRYIITDHTTMRLGAHFTSSIIGIRKQSKINSEMQVISENLDFYGYAFSENGLLETTNAKGYVMLAIAFRQGVKNSFNYSNRTSIIGGGKLEKTISGN